MPHYENACYYSQNKSFCVTFLAFTHMRDRRLVQLTCRRRQVRGGVQGTSMLVGMCRGRVRLVCYLTNGVKSRAQMVYEGHLM